MNFGLIPRDLAICMTKINWTPSEFYVDDLNLADVTLRVVAEGASVQSHSSPCRLTRTAGHRAILDHRFHVH